MYVEIHGTAPSETPSVEVQPQGSTSWVNINKLSADGVATVSAEVKNWTMTYTDPDITKFNISGSNALSTATVVVKGYWWRRVAINHVGVHTVRLTSGSDVLLISWTTVSPKPRTAKNVILFVGDGLNIPIMTATRLVSRGQTAGKLNDKLFMQTLERVGIMSTSGIDSVITDSANSAYAYSGGHKSSLNCLGVYGDSDEKATSAAMRDYFNDPKIELITERLRRESPGTAIGVVTTSEIQDATPAAFWAHTRRRATKARITEQILIGAHGYGPVLPDVILGGGGHYFNTTSCPTTTNNCLAGRNLWAESVAKGYSVVHDRAAMKAQSQRADKLMGIFHKYNMDTWVDRRQMTWNLAPANFPVAGVPARNVTDQPDLQEATETAISMLARKGGDNGFFLMVEGASIDKAEHPMDFDRAMGEFIDFDNAIGSAIAFSKTPAGKDTLILVTSDHAQGYDAYGTVDTLVFNAPNPADDAELDLAAYKDVEKQKAQAIAVYADAGFPTYVDVNGDYFPDSWSPRYTLAQGKADHLEVYREDFQPNPTMRVPTSNPADKQGLRLQGDTATNQNGGQTAHTFADIPVYGSGPGSQLLKGHMDNVDLHFVMAQALGLGTKTAIFPAVMGGNVPDITCSAVVPSVVKHATLGLLTTVCPQGATHCDATRPLVVGSTTYYKMKGTMEDFHMKAADSCSA